MDHETQVFRLFLGGLPDSIKQFDIQHRFSSYGDVSDVCLPTKVDENGQTVGKNFGYITLTTTEKRLDDLILAFRGIKWGDRTFSVERAKTPNLAGNSPETAAFRAKQEKMYIEKLAEKAKKYGTALPKSEDDYNEFAGKTYRMHIPMLPLHIPIPVDVGKKELPKEVQKRNLKEDLSDKYLWVWKFDQNDPYGDVPGQTIDGIKYTKLDPRLNQPLSATNSTSQPATSTLPEELALPRAKNEKDVQNVRHHYSFQKKLAQTVGKIEYNEEGIAYTNIKWPEINQKLVKATSEYLEKHSKNAKLDDGTQAQTSTPPQPFQTTDGLHMNDTSLVNFVTARCKGADHPTLRPLLYPTYLATKRPNHLRKIFFNRFNHEEARIKAFFNKYNVDQHDIDTLESKKANKIRLTKKEMHILLKSQRIFRTYMDLVYERWNNMIHDIYIDNKERQLMLEEMKNSSKKAEQRVYDFPMAQIDHSMLGEMNLDAVDEVFKEEEKIKAKEQRKTQKEKSFGFGGDDEEVDEDDFYADYDPDLDDNLDEFANFGEQQWDESKLGKTPHKDKFTEASDDDYGFGEVEQFNTGERKTRVAPYDVELPDHLKPPSSAKPAKPQRYAGAEDSNSSSSESSDDDQENGTQKFDIFGGVEESTDDDEDRLKGNKSGQFGEDGSEEDEYEEDFENVGIIDDTPVEGTAPDSTKPTEPITDKKRKIMGTLQKDADEQNKGGAFDDADEDGYSKSEDLMFKKRQKIISKAKDATKKKSKNVVSFDDSIIATGSDLAKSTINLSKFDDGSDDDDDNTNFNLPRVAISKKSTSSKSTAMNTSSSDSDNDHDGPVRSKYATYHSSNYDDMEIAGAEDEYDDGIYDDETKHESDWSDMEELQRSAAKQAQNRGGYLNSLYSIDQQKYTDHDEHLGVNDSVLKSITRAMGDQDTTERGGYREKRKDRKGGDKAGNFARGAKFTDTAGKRSVFGGGGNRSQGYNNDLRREGRGGFKKGSFGDKKGGFRGAKGRPKKGPMPCPHILPDFIPPHAFELDPQQHCSQIAEHRLLAAPAISQSQSNSASISFDQFLDSTDDELDDYGYAHYQPSRRPRQFDFQRNATRSKSNSTSLVWLGPLPPPPTPPHISSISSKRDKKEKKDKKDKKEKKSSKSRQITSSDGDDSNRYFSNIPSSTKPSSKQSQPEASQHASNSQTSSKTHPFSTTIAQISAPTPTELPTDVGGGKSLRHLFKTYSDADLAAIELTQKALLKHGGGAVQEIVDNVSQAKKKLKKSTFDLVTTVEDDEKVLESIRQQQVTQNQNERVGFAFGFDVSDDETAAAPAPKPAPSSNDIQSFTFNFDVSDGDGQVDQSDRTQKQPHKQAGKTATVKTVPTSQFSAPNSAFLPPSKLLQDKMAIELAQKQAKQSKLIAKHEQIIENQVASYNYHRQIDIISHLLRVTDNGFDTNPFLNPYHGSQVNITAKETVHQAILKKKTYSIDPNYAASFKYSFLLHAPQLLEPDNIMYRVEQDDFMIKEYQQHRDEMVSAQKKRHADRRAARRARRQEKREMQAAAGPRMPGEDKDGDEYEAGDEIFLSDDDDENPLDSLCPISLWDHQSQTASKYFTQLKKSGGAEQHRQTRMQHAGNKKTTLRNARSGKASHH